MARPFGRALSFRPEPRVYARLISFMQSSFAVQRAHAAFQQGDLDTAAHWADAAFRVDPKDPEVLLVRGMVMNARGSFQEAASAFRTLTRLQPQEPAHWMNLATTERAAGHLDSAATGYESAAKLGGWSAVLHYNTALLEFERGNFPLAREHLAQAASFWPVDAEIACRYAQSLMQSGEPAALREALRDWQHWENWSPDLLAEVAMLLLTTGDQRSALGISERLSLNSNNPLSVELTLITMLERTNRLEEATRRLNSVDQPGLHIPPELHSRWLNLRAQMASRNGQIPKAIALYREILLGEVPLEVRHEILFPLAKALDADRQSEAAFDAIASAHGSQMAHFDLTAPVTDAGATDLTGIAASRCDREDVVRWKDPSAPPVQDSPIFIVAFPRSGTTLLEQMLDAHPDVQSMDEQRFLLDAQEYLQDTGVEYPNKMADLSPEQLSAARRHYWDKVATKVQLKPGQRLLDKNPLNILRLPVITRLWPNAPILLAIRHPFDVIISNFFQQYRAPDFARLCRDLPTLGSGYAAVFDHWYKQVDILQPKVLEVFYEEFVSNFDGHARTIAAHCELSWHDAMLEPSIHAKAKGYIGTPSYHQVVQPVNSKAVGRWRLYENELRPLQAHVDHLMARWGYSA
jgi:Flp pilus assembly protein TadD